MKILQAAYADGRYSIHYGAEDTSLGRLSLATDAGGAITAADDTGVDLMRGSTGVDTFDGKGGNDRLYGFAGDDILRGGDGDDILVGSDGIDTLEGGAGADRLFGGNDGDMLYGGEGADSLYGGNDGDTLEGGAGADLVNGGAGADTASYANSVDTDGDGKGVTVNLFRGSTSGDDAVGDSFVSIENLLGSALDDNLRGDTGDNTLTGGEGVDSLYGLAGIDTLQGGAGDDRLFGGEDNDFLEGGAGRDTYVFGGNWGTDTIRGETDGGILWFKDATGIGDLGFSTDENNDVIVKGRASDNSVKILQAAYADGRYSISYGADNTQLGGLSVGTLNDDEGTDKITGTAGDDLLLGLAGSDTLEGGGGVDTLYGHSGIDTLTGGEGADTLYGGGGDDFLEGGAGEDIYVFGGRWGTDTIRGETANTNGGKLYFKDATGLGSFDFSRDTEGNVIIGDRASDNAVKILQAAYADGRYSIHYGADDTSLGRLSLATDAGGAITAAGDTGVDLMRGSTGVDTFDGKGGNDRLYGFAGDDILRGGDGDDVLVGSDGIDTLEGGAGADRLFGGNDDDTLEGGAGADLVNGGAGADTASYANSVDTDGDGQGVTVNLFRGSTSGDDAVGDSFVNIENLLGSALNDNLRGDTGDNTLTGGEGVDSLYGLAGVDTLYGGAGDDRLFGGADSDTLEGGAGVDMLNGGDGRDTLSYASSVDTDGDSLGVTINLLSGATFGDDAKDDTFVSIENLLGSALKDTLIGDTAANRLRGGAGDDTLTGGEGNDFLEGGDGADTYIFEGRHAADTIRNDADGGTLWFKDATGIGDFRFSLDSNNNVLITHDSNSVRILRTAYADGRYSISYGAGDTSLGKLSVGTKGADPSITGSSGVDLLYGFAGIDTLQGGEGADTLYGGGGNDFLEGGAGKDIYVFDGRWGADTIQGETANTNGGILWFKDATGIGDLRFSTDENNNAIIAVGDNSVKILQDAYADGRYSISYGADNTQLGGLSVGTINDDEGTDKITGTAGDDLLLGLAGSDTLEGGGGADTLYGGVGDDFLEGGAGEDIYIFGGRWGTDTIRGETVDTDGGKLYFKDATGLGSFDFSRDTEGNVIIDDRASDNAVKILQAAYADGRYSIHYGAEDTSLGRLSLATDAGGAITAADDTSADLMRGSTGVDTFDGKGGNDRLYGFAGDDILRGGDGDDILVGSDGIDTLEGGAGADRLFGGNDDDTLEGGAGADLVNGGAGADTLSYANSVDTDGDGQGVTVNLFRDSASGDDAEDDSFFNIENLLGSALNDNLRGDTGANTLIGGDGADRLYGLAGIDTLYGGTGDDMLYGGEDADTYAFFVGDGTDTIYDVAGGSESLTLIFATSQGAAEEQNYDANDFTISSGNFARVDRDLEITLDKDSNDGIDDKITIKNAYSADTGEAAFTINVQYGSGDSFTEVASDFWHTLAG